MFFSFKDFFKSQSNLCGLCNEEVASYGSICETCRNKLLYPSNNLITYVDNISPIAVSLKYNDFIKNTIWDFKFKNKTYLYRPLGDIMIETILHTEIYKGVDIVTAVPMGAADFRYRGYNQSALLAEYICSELNLNYREDIITKLYSGKKQIDVDYTGRWDNVKKAFASKDVKAIEDSNILIVDDILTSGSTLRACGKTLLEAGASSIVGLALASPSLL